MRKLLLVIFIGLVLAMNLYGIVNEAIDIYEEKFADEIKGYTIVQVE